MANRIAGTAYVRVDGTQYALRGNLTASPSRVQRSGLAGMDGVHGYSEAPRVPFIEGDFSLIPELSVEDIEAMTGVTVTAEFATGTVYTLIDAWTVAAFELNAAEGTVRVRWEGRDTQEVS